VEDLNFGIFYRKTGIELTDDPKSHKDSLSIQCLVDRHYPHVGTAEAYRNLPEGHVLRFTAREMRMSAIENLDVLLETLAGNIRKNGGHVHFADRGQEGASATVPVRGHGYLRLQPGLR
jgi:L-lactate dehydrogenase complex protein LldF